MSANLPYHNLCFCLRYSNEILVQTSENMSLLPYKKAKESDICMYPYGKKVAIGYIKVEISIWNIPSLELIRLLVIAIKALLCSKQNLRYKSNKNSIATIKSIFDA